MTATHRVESRRGSARAQEQSVTKPTDLPKPSLVAVLKRARVEFRNDNLTTLAAALTYYAVLAMVPGLIVLFTAIGLFGKSLVNRVVHQVNAVAPGSAGQFVKSILTQVQSHRTGTGIVAVVGIAVALWSASSYVNGFRQASNVIYGIGEGRPVWKTVPMRVMVTAVAVVILVICALIVVVSGSVAAQVGNSIGAGHVAVVVWSIAKWPVLVVLVSALLAILYWATPNAKIGGIKWVSPGGVIATALWLILSGLFSIYVIHFSTYNKTYGSLAGIVIFLIWLWLSNVAVLLGAEVNAELDHAKAVAEGMPEDVRPFAEPRDTRKLDAHDRADVEAARTAR